MTKAELIKLLANVPDDARIAIDATRDDYTEVHEAFYDFHARAVVFYLSPEVPS